MEMAIQLARTVKGQEEIFNLGHTLRPRYRQFLFDIGNGISYGELCRKRPKCVELESIVNELLQSGFIQMLRNTAPAHVAGARAAAPIAAPVQATGNLSEAQDFVLKVMATLVGTKSPAYN